MKGREIKVIAPLEKFECARQNIDLSENLRIREILDKERKLIWDSDKMRAIPMLPHGPIETLKYGLETSYEARTEALVESPPSWVTEEINRAVSSLRLYKAGKVGCNIVLVLDRIPFIHFSGGLPNISFPVFGQKYVLAEVEIEELRKFWNKFKIVDTTKRGLEFLDVARRRFNYTYERQKFDDRLIDCMISFESLFLKGGEMLELAYRLSLRSAVMLAEKSNERKGVFLDMKTAYGLRSMIVHGEDLKRIHEVVKNKFDSYKKLSMKMENYLRKSIRTFFEEVSEEHLVKNIKDKIIDNLDEGIFDKKSLIR